MWRYMWGRRSAGPATPTTPPQPPICIECEADGHTKMRVFVDIARHTAREAHMRTIAFDLRVRRPHEGGTHAGTPIGGLVVRKEPESSLLEQLTTHADTGHVIHPWRVFSDIAPWVHASSSGNH